MLRPFGNVYIEGLACGKPVVGHETQSTRWILGEHGTLVDATDLAATTPASRGFEDEEQTTPVAAAGPIDVEHLVEASGHRLHQSKGLFRRRNAARRGAGGARLKLTKLVLKNLLRRKGRRRGLRRRRRDCHRGRPRRRG